jgi:myo-inositol-1(or 4)-monophosphatase
MNLQVDRISAQFNCFSHQATYVAIEAALLGANIVESVYGTSVDTLQTKYKADAGMSPVTIADWQSEEIITQTIKKYYPAHQINKEESGIQEGQEKVWYVDPLDGTSSFIRGQRYSTVGVSVYIQNGDYLSSVIVNPFEKEILVAERGKGAYLLVYDRARDTLQQPERINVSSRGSIKGSIAYIDASVNAKTVESKLTFMKNLSLLAIGEDKKGKIGIRMTGSNIDQQRQIAAGRAEIGLTDAIGGPYDWRSGYAILKEASGSMLDAHTGKEPTDDSVVVIYGNQRIVSQILPIAQDAYRSYGGFK